MNIRAIPDRVLAPLLESAAGRTIQSMVEILERRPGYGLHLIAGAPRDDEQRGQRVALAIVLTDQESRPWGMTVVEYDEAQLVRTVCAIGAVDVTAADAVGVVKLSIGSLKDDPLGKEYDFSLEDE